ncbi:MAG: type II toxin-antitoxin system prevent-host-death family antitoxin [Streptosporangiales bacterium]|nr:type II toxin-antitoxin system prevent-host-death family antitoxin [Streptosporangiales bacterium]
MSEIAARDLRNRTAEILRRVEAGEEIDVLRDNRPVARIIPMRSGRRWIPAEEVISQLERIGPYPGDLRSELREVMPDTTDDLRW